MILAVETATEVCSIALKLDNGKIEEERVAGKAVHSEMMFRFIELLLKKHEVRIDELSQILISRGPGQYTGLRIGAAGVKGLMLKKNVELWSIGTLEGFTAAVKGRGDATGAVHAVIDARRKHLYHQSFKITDDRIISEGPAILQIKDIDSILDIGDTIIGTGLERLSSYGNVKMKFLDHSYISAVNLIKARVDSRFDDFFKQEDPAAFDPVYLTTRQVNNTITG
jgi:tRNA threonylcarbamoyladenosine biosynthesis protein TsaB